MQKSVSGACVLLHLWKQKDDILNTNYNHKMTIMIINNL